jgi:hypothetical protein
MRVKYVQFEHETAINSTSQKHVFTIDEDHFGHKPHLERKLADQEHLFIEKVHFKISRRDHI